MEGDHANRLEVAYTLGRVVSSWIELGAAEIRKKQALTLPGGDQSNYLHAFKHIWVKDGKIPVADHGARIFYAELFFTVGWQEKEQQVVLTLLPGQRKASDGKLVTCELIIDRTGWTAGAKNALRRELASSYSLAREHWKTRLGARVRVFALAEQDAEETATFRVADPRLILLTDESARER